MASTNYTSIREAWSAWAALDRVDHWVADKLGSWALDSSGTLTDLNSLAASNSLTSGEVRFTLDPNILTANPDDGAYYTWEVQPLGASVSVPKLVGWLACRVETEPSASTDVEVYTILATHADLANASCAAFGVGVRMSGSSLQIAVVRCEAGAWSYDYSVSADANTVTSACAWAYWGDNLSASSVRYVVAIPLDTNGAQVHDHEEVSTNIDAIDFSSGAYLHAVAVRTVGDNVAPNNATETVHFRALASLSAVDLGDTGVAP